MPGGGSREHKSNRVCCASVTNSKLQSIQVRLDVDTGIAGQFVLLPAK